jgi:hypothetical protein
MKKLNFTKEQLIDSLTFTEDDYNKAIEGCNEYAIFDEFIQNIMDSCKECNGILGDAISIAENSFESLGKKIYDVYFNDDDSSNNKGWNETYGYCKNYIEDNNGTNESYFADYKGGTVSIYNNETEEDVYIETVR